LGLWPYLAANVTLAGTANAYVPGMRISWTDGTRDATTGALNWYDKGFPRIPNIVNDPPHAWMNMTVSDSLPSSKCQDPPNLGWDIPEFKANYRLQPNPAIYAAMWSYMRKDNWPKALRIDFQIGTDSPQAYRVVISLPD
jgi:hypothetical protein